MVALNSNSPDVPPSERRTSRRRPLEEIPVITDVKVQSERVKVVNASSGGLLIEGSLRLVPGVASQLEIVRVDGSIRVRGRVVRSEVAGIVDRTIQYRIAIAFDRPLDFIDQDPSGSGLAPSPADDVADVIVLCEVAETELDQHLALNSW